MFNFAEGADSIDTVISSSVSQEALGVHVEDMPSNNTSPVTQEQPEKTGKWERRSYILLGLVNYSVLGNKTCWRHKIEHQHPLLFSLIDIHNTTCISESLQ